VIAINLLRSQQDEARRAKQRAKRKRWQENNPEAYRAWQKRRAASWRTRNLERYKVRRNKGTSKWRETHPERAKLKDKRRNLSVYGLTPSDYEQMLENQKYECPICCKTLDLGINTHVDHDHETGTVRAILCRTCNLRMAVVDDIELLAKLIAYRDKHKAQNAPKIHPGTR
jgi:hypothetical protein